MNQSTLVLETLDEESNFEHYPLVFLEKVGLRKKKNIYIYIYIYIYLILPLRQCDVSGDLQRFCNEDSK